MCERASRFLKLLPIAALFAAGASQAWTDCKGGKPYEHFGPIACVGTGGGSGNTVTVSGSGSGESGMQTYATGGASCKEDAACTEGLDTSGKANGNTLIVEGDVENTAAGGHAGVKSAEANGNTVIVNKGEVDTVVGGLVQGTSAQAKNNTVTIKGGSVSAVYGGRNPEGASTHNTVTISGGEVKGDVYGSEGYDEATHNTVTISGGTEVAGDVRGGNFTSLSGGDALTGNMLVLDKIKSFQVKGGVTNFAKLSVTLPADIEKNGIVLDVGGEAQFRPSGTTDIEVKAAGALPESLVVGNKITLIRTKTGVLIDPNLTEVKAGGYKFDVKKTGNDLYLEVTGAAPEPDLDVKMSKDGEGKFVFKAERTSNEVTVKNIGSAAASGATWKATKAGTEVASGTLPDIAKGGETKFSFKLDDAGLDGAEVCVIVELTGDADTDNNKDCAPAKVSGGGGGGAFTVTGTVSEGSGTVKCEPESVALNGKSTCTATPGSGYTLGSEPKLDSGTATAKCKSNKCDLTGIKSDVVVSAKFTKIGAFKVSGSPVTGGTVECIPDSVDAGGTSTCTAIPDKGYKLDGVPKLDDSSAGKATATCDGDTCELSDITGDVAVSAVFKKPPVPATTAQVPTMSEIGLLLSGIALAGAAAPALRRRERKEGKRN